MIELKEVIKYYGTKAVGLSNVNVTINKGEIVGILGENGSGKTTLLKVIMGLTGVTRGEVLIEGEEPQKMYNKLAYITEEGSYFSYMTPLEYGEFLSTFYEKFDIERYKKLLEYFEIKVNKKIRSFSKGQKSKLEISAGFAKGAKYILMDEPFLGKDLFTRKDFLKLMVLSLKEDETIIISTHLLNEIEHIIDRAIILSENSVKADFYLEEMREEGKTLTEVMMELTGYDANRYKQVFEI